jgi:hypothetical protein
VTRLVDAVCLLGVVALGSHALYAGAYLTAVFLLATTGWLLVLRASWHKRGRTNAERLASLLDDASELDSA